MQLRTEFIHNGRGSGEFSDHLMRTELCTNRMRPYFESDRDHPWYGRPCIDEKVGEVWNKKTKSYEPVFEQQLIERYDPIYNATALRKDEWLKMDDRIIQVTRPRLKAWTDLAGANSITIDGFGTMVFGHETSSDPGEAMVDMDGDGGPRDDKPLYQLEGLPLPITYGAYSMSSRMLAESRKGNSPLDTRKAEAYARRVAEIIEKTLIGTVAGLQYGDRSEFGRTVKVYGYTNFPARVTKTDLTTPTTTNGTDVLADFLEMRELMAAQNFHGPFIVYTSTSYDQFLDHDFKSNSDKTTRQRLLEIDGVQSIRRLDYLTSGYQQIWVQMTSEVARAVLGMPITTVQWDERGGSRLNFRIMTIQVPQLFATYTNQCGIGHATTA